MNMRYVIAERTAECPCGKSGITPQTLRNAWLGRQDSNLRMPVPKTGALPLGYAPAGRLRLARHRREGKRTVGVS
jgi:hypothetical protein